MAADQSKRRCQTDEGTDLQLVDLSKTFVLHFPANASSTTDSSNILARIVDITMSKLKIVSAAAAFSLISGLTSNGLPAPFVMPWLCLERCGDNSSVISAQIQQFVSNRTVLNAASFEDFNLGLNGAGLPSLIKNNLTQVAPTLQSLGVQRYAMISSYPYPPQFLTWMRQLFASPGAFIAECISAAKEENLTGFNIDFEPVVAPGAPTPTNADAVAYASFLDTFAKAMHNEGIAVSVDVATWSALWNLTLIGNSAVDAVMTMQTYTDDWPTFQAKLTEAAATIPADKLVVGLETVQDSTNAPYSDEQLQQRFDLIRSLGLRRVGLWRAGVPDNWWQFLDAL